MRRILVFCARDWRNPKAGAAEQFMHAVVSRMARQGHYIAWVAHGPFAWNVAQSSIDTVDSIQVARMGIRPFYRFMSQLMLKRMVQGGHLKVEDKRRRFDVILEVIQGRPLAVHHFTDIPVSPIVFRAPRRLGRALPPDGPVFAPTEAIANALEKKGVEPSRIVQTPFGWGAIHGNGAADFATRDTPPTILVVENRPAALLRTFQKGTESIRVRLVSSDGPVATPEGLELERWNGDPTSAIRQGTSGVRVAFLGRGFAHLAVEMHAAGIPVVCEDLPMNREFVENNETGLLVRGPEEAGQALQRLVTDSVLRARFSETAQARVERKTWDAIANQILNSILPSHLPTP